MMHKILCKLGFHDWEIIKVCWVKDRTNKIKKENYHRVCRYCEKDQALRSTKQALGYYSPCEYVWSDKTEYDYNKI